MAQVLDSLERYDVLPNQSVAILAGPAARLGFAAAEERLRESPERQERPEVVRSPDAEFTHGERVQAQQMITSLQRLAAEAIEIQLPAARNQNLLALVAPVVQTLQVVAPAAVLVEFIEHPEPGRRKLSPENPLAVRHDVPVEVAGPSSWNRSGAAPRRWTWPTTTWFCGWDS